MTLVRLLSRTTRISIRFSCGSVDHRFLYFEILSNEKAGNRV